jgi:hypothetical protein
MYSSESCPCIDSDGPFTAVDERSRPVAVSHGTDEGERRRE